MAATFSLAIAPGGIIVFVVVFHKVGQCLGLEYVKEPAILGNSRVALLEHSIRIDSLKIIVRLVDSLI